MLEKPKSTFPYKTTQNAISRDTPKSYSPEAKYWENVPLKSCNSGPELKTPSLVLFPFSLIIKYLLHFTRNILKNYYNNVYYIIFCIIIYKITILLFLILNSIVMLRFLFWFYSIFPPTWFLLFYIYKVLH